MSNDSSLSPNENTNITSQSDTDLNKKMNDDKTLALIAYVLLIIPGLSIISIILAILKLGSATPIMRTHFVNIIKICILQIAAVVVYMIFTAIAYSTFSMTLFSILSIAPLIAYIVFLVLIIRGALKAYNLEAI